MKTFVSEKNYCLKCWHFFHLLINFCSFLISQVYKRQETYCSANDRPVQQSRYAINFGISLINWLQFQTIDKRVMKFRFDFIIFLIEKHYLSENFAKKRLNLEKVCPPNELYGSYERIESFLAQNMAECMAVRIVNWQHLWLIATKVLLQKCWVFGRNTVVMHSFLCILCNSEPILTLVGHWNESFLSFESLLSAVMFRQFNS